MANVEQWVNLPKQAIFVEDEVASMERAGFLHFECEFKKAKMANFKVRVVPHGSQAKYTKKEQKNPNFKLRRIPAQSNGSGKNIKLETDVYLPAAGGCEYKIEAKYKGKVVEASKIVETRRKLYYQVIKMKNMTVTVKTLTDHMEDEFWTSGKKYFVRLKQIPSKGEIAGFPNFDVSQQGQIPNLAKANYSNAKDPFCFALVLVDQLGRSKKSTVKKKVKIKKKSPTVAVSVTPHYLWVDLDPAGTAEAKWNFGGKFVDAGGASHPIDPAKITKNGRTSVNVDTSSLPDGAGGTIELNLKLVDYFRTGLSLSKNLICVATRATWAQRDDDEMKSTLVHEAGHKMGMVPGGGGKGLAKQSTYYQKNGGHCNFSVNTCVMFGSIHAGRSNRFCSVCEKSVRRLDLDASVLPGFVPP